MARRSRKKVPTTGVSMVGADELQAALLALPEDLSGPVLLAGVVDGAEIVRDVAIQLAPRSADGAHGRDPGFLAAHIDTELESLTPHSAEVAVGVQKKAFYGLFQEFGTRHHAAQPFLRPALDETAGDVVDQIRETIEALVMSSLNKTL